MIWVVGWVGMVFMDISCEIMMFLVGQLRQNQDL